MSLTVWTLGHSTRRWEEFLELLREHGIHHAVDVRRFPGSRRHPHFGREQMRAAAAQAGIEYEHAPELGGRRAPAPDSPNTAWRNASFRAYADYMATPGFAAALERLITVAAESPTAIFCSEAVWWRCHRRMISDALVARGVRVVHILAPGQTAEHTLNPEARLRPDGTLVYPRIEPQTELLE